MATWRPIARAAGPELLLVLAAALLFFTRLNAPLQEPDEARYAEVPRQMLVEGSWLVPVLHGQPYYDKPPLLYWSVMIAYRTLGVHDWAARLASSGPAFLLVLVTYWYGRRMFGRGAGIAGALVLCLSARFVYLGRLLTPDSMLALWVVVASAAGQLALGRARFRLRWWLVSALALGLGMLTKGPVALALVLPPLVGYRFLSGASIGVRAWALYMLLALGIAAPWFIAISVSEPEFVGYFFWRHNVVRYTAPFDHAKPFWFHLPGLVWGMLPWILALPGLVRHLIRDTGDRARLAFLLTAFLWCVLFYSASGSKRAVYIIPALPPLALALGWYIYRLWRTREEQLAWVSVVLVLAASCAGSLLAVAEGLLAPSVGVAAAGVSIVGCLALLWRMRGAGRVGWEFAAIATFLVLLGGVYAVLPGYARRFSVRGQVRRHLAVVDEVAVVCYPRPWDSVSYYLRRTEVMAFSVAQRSSLLALLRARPQTLVFVKAGTALDELIRDLPAGFEFVPEGRQGTLAVGWVRARTPDDANHNLDWISFR